MLVRVENINDNPPRFDKSEFTLNVNEVRTSHLAYNGHNIVH